MPIFPSDQERKPKRPVLELLLATVLVSIGFAALAVVAVMVVVYATGGSVFIVPGAHASHH